MFEPLLRHWQTVTEMTSGLEAWPSFCKRVTRGIQRMTDQPGRSRRVAAFTSGGFIGVAIQHVLGAPDSAALEINWRIRNGAVTEFVFSGERITLDSFNSVAQFDDPALVTYR
jgi:broad specificity phosphatase PhoE